MCVQLLLALRQEQNKYCCSSAVVLKKKLRPFLGKKNHHPLESLCGDYTSWGKSFSTWSTVTLTLFAEVILCKYYFITTNFTYHPLKWENITIGRKGTIKEIFLWSVISSISFMIWRILRTRNTAIGTKSVSCTYKILMNSSKI